MGLCSHIGGEDLLEPGKAGEGVLLGTGGLTLDEGEGVVDEGLLHTVAGGVDPLAGDLLLEVGHDVQGLENGLTGVLAALAGAGEGHHLVGVAGHGGLHGHTTGHLGLFHVHLGGQVGATALEEGELDAPDLGAGLVLDEVGQLHGQAAQLGVTEAVGGGGLRLGDEAAVGVVDALGHGHQALAGLVVDIGDVLDELVHVEVHLGQVDQIGAAAGEVGQSGGAGQPAGVTAHDLDDGHHAGVIDPGVLINLHAGGGDILGRGGEAGAVIGAEQVVVDSLGHAHDATLIAHLLHVLGDLVAGVHGVVAAVVEEIAHVVLLEDLQNTLIVGVVHIGVGDLVAAGTQLGGGGVQQQLQLPGVLLAHVIELVVQNALDAVGRAVDRGDVRAVQRGADHAVRAGVDDRGGASGLAEDGHVVRIPSEAGDVVPDPPQGRDDVVASRIAGVGVFLPEVRQIKIADDIEPVIDGDGHHVSVPAHVLPLIGDVLNGGAGFIAASVQPDQDGAPGIVAARRPQIQIQAVLIHRPVAVRHVKLAVGPGKRKLRADKAEAAGVEHIRPALRGLRRAKTLRSGIGDALENEDIIRYIAPHLSPRGLHHGGFVVTSKYDSHKYLHSAAAQAADGLPFFIIYQNEKGRKTERRI